MKLDYNTVVNSNGLSWIEFVSFMQDQESLNRNCVLILTDVMSKSQTKNEMAIKNSSRVVVNDEYVMKSE